MPAGEDAAVREPGSDRPSYTAPPEHVGLTDERAAALAGSILLSAVRDVVALSSPNGGARGGLIAGAPSGRPRARR